MRDCMRAERLKKLLRMNNNLVEYRDKLSDIKETKLSGTKANIQRED